MSNTPISLLSSELDHVVFCPGKHTCPKRKKGFPLVYFSITACTCKCFLVFAVFFLFCFISFELISMNFVRTEYRKKYTCFFKRNNEKRKKERKKDRKKERKKEREREKITYRQTRFIQTQKENKVKKEVLKQKLNEIV